MAEIDSRVTILEEYTEEVEAIKKKIADIAKQENILINVNIDTPLSVLAKIGNIIGTDSFKKYHIEQTVTGDTCTIAITDYVAQESDNYLIGVIAKDGKQKLYIVEE